MTSTPDDKFFLSWLHVWNKEFTIRREVSHHEANKPYVAVQESIQPRPESDIIENFVTTDESELFTKEKARQIQTFCRSARRIEDLQRPAAVRIPVALLHESDSSGLRRSTYRCKLLAKQLYDALQRPRLRRRRICSGNTPDDPDCLSIKLDPTEAETGELQEPDAERRLVYITNLDEWTVLVLAATASYCEAQALRLGICNYLEFNASIDVFIPPEGISTFALTFHLPFYALRTSHSSAMVDERKNSDGQPLRQCQDVTFLDSNCRGPIYLYESQVSCIVTGWDRYVWTAYLFIDLYFDDSGEESLEGYEDQIEQLEQLGVSDSTCDPLLRGEGTSQPTRKPREYFLRCFDVRSRMVVNEWHQLVTELLKYIKASRESHHYPPRTKSDMRSTLETNDDEQKRREFLVWSNQVMELLSKLSKGLDESIIAWKTFSAGSVGCFHSPGSQWNISERDQRRLLVIQRHFTEMTRLQRQLRLMSDEFHDLTKDLQLKLANENNESAFMQQATARDVKILTYITFACTFLSSSDVHSNVSQYTIPFAIAAAFLSTRDGFFPVPENPLSLLVLLVTIEILVFLLFDKLSDWRTCGPFIQQVWRIVSRRPRVEQGGCFRTGNPAKKGEV